ncbi:hypothetical protein SeLEV6574_g02832 [Synchytrium endobioticum]|uniref:WLM domain-containing protein n=1 Tax=Synchytrium endobioticum TaxID=286115 RepID=A0A507D8F1_9FUNG|nr:hypothetical protein SeLEV6574_g02832 [Synchytrium endobioticum]
MDNAGYAPYIGSIESCKLVNDQAAMGLLNKVATMVKPIMKNRSFKVGKLSELHPTSHRPELYGLNENGGRRILLRLRPHHHPTSFLHFESIIATMLHELTHNLRGPHDAQFYKILDSLKDEYDKLLASGYQGEGFHGPGNRVGAGISHNHDQRTAHRMAAEAAEKRLRLSKLMAPSGGVRLGSGVSSSKLEGMLTPAQMAAMAAARRAQDAVWCGNHDDGTVDSNEIDGNNANGGSNSSHLNRPACPTERPAVSATSCSDRSDQSSSRNRVHTFPKKKEKANGDLTAWTCKTCTYINQPLFLMCEVCETDKPSPGTAAFPLVVLDSDDEKMAHANSCKSLSFHPQTPSTVKTSCMGPTETATDSMGDGSLVFHDVWICVQCAASTNMLYRMCSNCQYLRPM